jgi:hypothetical protein
MHTDAGPRAYQRAATLARNEMPGAPVPKLDELIDENGVVKAMPNMQFLHYLKMGLDDLHSSAVSGGETGMGKTVARSIAGVRNSFRDAARGGEPGLRALGPVRRPFGAPRRARAGPAGDHAEPRRVRGRAARAGQPRRAGDVPRRGRVEAERHAGQASAAARPPT